MGLLPIEELEYLFNGIREVLFYVALLIVLYIVGEFTVVYYRYKMEAKRLDTIKRLGREVLNEEIVREIISTIRTFAMEYSDKETVVARRFFSKPVAVKLIFAVVILYIVIMLWLSFFR